mgnify:CR=1 FL=1
MSIKTTFNYSPNFTPVKRSKKKIKFLIFHYTGMKNEISAIKRLTSIQSEVGAHYFIKINGEIITMVPDLYVAWHAGLSQWGKYKSLNYNSIGIEISNIGHKFGYKKFTTKQIRSIKKLSLFLIKKYKINKKFIMGHSDIAPERKKDPGEKFPWEIFAKNNVGIWHELNKSQLIKFRKKKLDIKKNINFIMNLKKIGYQSRKKIIKDKKKFQKYLVLAFQRRFRQELINGIIDQECLLISQNLLKIKF